MNMNDPRTNPETDSSGADPHLPAELVAALRQDEARWTLDVPVEREAQLLASCHAELKDRLTEARVVSSSGAPNQHRATGMSPFPESQTESRITPFPRGWLRWAGAAAAVLVVVLGLAVALRPRSEDATLEINVAQPTVLDAFAFAQALESRVPGGARHVDLNGDGQVDQADVNWLAQRAVQLPEGGAL
jgi:hypothetical protein